MTVRSLAFYLPQFHAVAENDEWWGPGFTEWRNVAKARPQFRGHYQPHEPERLGYYDLRLDAVRHEQAALAREHRIDGFIYYHYWFNSRRLLEMPVQRLLADRTLEFPFALCWANENWTRVWDGSSREVLLGQEYGAEDDAEHIEALLPILHDPRYIRVDGRPLVLIYRISSHDNPRRLSEVWRQAAEASGLSGLFLATVRGLGESVDPVSIGFDAAVDFQPSPPLVPRHLSGRRPVRAMNGVRPLPGRLKHHVVSYDGYVDAALKADEPPYSLYPCVTPSWDNTARRRTEALILHRSSPQAYQRWVTAALEKSRQQAAPDHLLFVNAWNEWAEGCHLEPDLRWGTAYLEAHRAAVEAWESEASLRRNLLAPAPAPDQG